MIALRIVGVVIGLAAIYATHINAKRKVFSRNESFLWIFVWGGFIGISLWPSSVNFLLETFNLSRTADLIMIIAFMVIYVLGFKNHLSNTILRNKVEALIRDNALRDLESKAEKSDNN